MQDRENTSGDLMALRSGVAPVFCSQEFLTLFQASAIGRSYQECLPERDGRTYAGT